MRILVTSDLHYDVARSKRPTEAVAREICAAGGDVLLIVGDTSSIDLSALDAALGLFDAFRGVKLAVAGNHELWVPPGGDSLHRYQNELPAAFSRNGFHLLDSGPRAVGDVAFVGSVGWYDYSYRPSKMGIPLRFFRSKVAPGAAEHFARHAHLVSETEDIAPSAMQVTTRWMDGERVRLPMGDVDFSFWLLERLRGQLEAVCDTARRVVAAVHHLPFFELVPHSVLPNLEFATAYLGSELFGELLLDYPTVRDVFSGHCHMARRCRRRHLECRAIGSTYREKTYEVLDV